MRTSPACQGSLLECGRPRLSRSAILLRQLRKHRRCRAVQLARVVASDGRLAAEGAHAGALCKTRSSLPPMRAILGKIPACAEPLKRQQKMKKMTSCRGEAFLPRAASSLSATTTRRIASTLRIAATLLSSCLLVATGSRTTETFRTTPALAPHADSLPPSTLRTTKGTCACALPSKTPRRR